MNIRIKRNNDKTYKVTVKKNGVAVDITGWTIYFAVKKKPNDSDSHAVISKVVTNHTDPENGLSAITINAADTADEKVDFYDFDLLFKDADGKRQSSQTGTFEIVQEIADGEAIS